MRVFVVTGPLLATLIKPVKSQNLLAPGNLDRFNYRETVRGERFSDYAPRDWINVRCQDLGICVSRNQPKETANMLWRL